MLRKIFQKMPRWLKHEIRRYRYRQKIRAGAFKSDELEFSLLDSLIAPGETVVDIGANVGHYTLLLSKLVGEGGRVIAFEPIASTFDLLSSNVVFGDCPNVTLVNAAVTDRAGFVSLTVPSGNFYQSHISDGGEEAVIGYPLERILPEETRTSFIKVDAEGCDELILNSSIHLIQKSRPTIMAELPVETMKELANRLEGYSTFSVAQSHNSLLAPTELSERLEAAGLGKFGHDAR